MTLTCECCPCSASIFLRAFCMCLTCSFLFFYFLFSILTATELSYNWNNCTSYVEECHTSYYSPSFQEWYITLTVLFYIVTVLTLLSLIIFWFCWDDGTRCFTKKRERITLIILTMALVILAVGVVPVILLRATNESDTDYDFYETFLAFTAIMSLFGCVCLVVIWYQNCTQNVVAPDFVVDMPPNEYVPPELEDIVLPWLIKKGDITNNWEQVYKYYRKSIDVNNKKYSYFIQLFFSQLDGKDIFVKEIFAVHNPTLFDQFNNRRKVMLDRQREDPDTWLQHQWVTEDHQKVWVYENYQKFLKSFQWNNKDPDLPIIPVLHGTDEDTAWKICRSGFAALARLDAGWYGSGNYFSTSAMYCFPYFGTKKNPALILSFVIPGNVFPVTESKDGPDSLLGKPIKKRCGSHYALVTKDGLVCKHRMERNYFTEIVIEQETQILPSFVFILDNKNFSELAVIYQRDIPDK